MPAIRGILRFTQNDKPIHCHPEGNARRIPWLLALCNYYCCGWDSSLPAEQAGLTLRMTTFFPCHPEDEVRRIPRLLTIHEILQEKFEF